MLKLYPQRPRPCLALRVSAENAPLLHQQWPYSIMLASTHDAVLVNTGHSWTTANYGDWIIFLEYETGRRPVMILSDATFRLAYDAEHGVDA